MKVKLNTVNNAALFSTKCNEFTEDIDYLYNRYILDAKSLLGVLSAGIDHVCTVTIHTDCTKQLEKIKESLKLWIVEDEI